MGEDDQNAGRETLELIVSDLKNEHSELVAAGFEPSAIEYADTISLVRLHDPDQNFAVLVQPRRARCPRTSSRKLIAFIVAWSSRVPGTVAPCRC